MSFTRAARISTMEISQIVQLSERAASLRTDGHDVIGLATGEPDFPTPQNVIEAANAAALAGKTKYPPTMGTKELRTEIAAQNGVEAKNVIVSTGAKQVLANAMLASLNDGDEVIMPAPFWTSYADIVKMAGGVPVILPCAMEAGFKITPERLQAAITPQTKWVMLNAPSNPSGALYSKDEQEALAKMLSAHPQVMILVDEIYELLSFEPFVSFKDVAPELSDRILVVNGVSKAYAMTGWRIGWGIGSADLISAMGAVQGQITSGACSIAQAAALEAISGDQTLVAERLKVLKARRDKVVAALNAMEGVTCPAPDGAFYVFPHIAEAVKAGGFADEGAFCAALLETQGLAIVPGSAFGLEGHVRLSFAYSDQELDEGLKRMAAFIASFSQS